jgi:hypothetical protein
MRMMRMGCDANVLVLQRSGPGSCRAVGVGTHYHLEALKHEFMLCNAANGILENYGTDAVIDV